MHKKVVDNQHKRSVLPTPIIKEIHEDVEVKNNWSVKYANPTSGVKVNTRKRRRMEENNIKATKVGSI